MTELENEFLESYKYVERLLNDAYNSRHGVTAYIDRMRDERSGWNLIPGWERDFYALKRVRNIRNYLTHENGISECTEHDLDFIDDFYDRLMNFDDPIARLNKLRNGSMAKERPKPSNNSDIHVNTFHQEKSQQYTQPHNDGNGFSLLVFVVAIVLFVLCLASWLK